VPEPELSTPLTQVFGDSFNGIADAPLQTGPCVLVAGYSWIAEGSFIASRRPPLLWSRSRQDYVTPPVPQYARVGDVIRGLLGGDLVLASDDCLVMHDARTGRSHLLSSCAGASLLYFSQIAGCVLFGTSIARFKHGRQAAIDVIALAEIVRFGASYGRRTLVSGIEQLPYAHRMELSVPGRLQIRPYNDYSHQPDDRVNESQARAGVEHALGESLRACTDAKHLMFSGGVDSSVLAAIGARDGLRAAWFLSMGEGDPEEEAAAQLAQRFHLDLNVIRLTLSLGGMVEIVRSYATPTLDFSILPTHFLGTRMAASGAETIVDGTGADSWFGFKNLEYARTWGRLARLPAIASTAARALYARLITHDTNALVRPLKVLSRLPRRRHAGLGNLCGSPLYAQLLHVGDSDWLQVEDSLLGLWSGLVGGHPQDDVAQVLTMEAALAAINQSAAKSSQWDLSASLRTLYPFLVPSIVAMGRTLSLRQLSSNGRTKPMLRGLLLEHGVPAALVDRTKAGFLPPLFGLLNNRRQRGDVLAWFEEPSELDDVFTPFARTLPRRLLSLGRELTFHAQNPLWAVLALKAWVSGLRQNRLAVF
jgi:hypothetical protein